MYIFIGLQNITFAMSCRGVLVLGEDFVLYFTQESLHFLTEHRDVRGRVTDAIE